jgi:cell division protease FtsH
MFLGGRQEITSRSCAEETQGLIDKEVARLLREAEERALKLLTEHRDELERLTELLLESETIDGEAVYRLVGRDVPRGSGQT